MKNSGDESSSSSNSKPKQKTFERERRFSPDPLIEQKHQEAKTHLKNHEYHLEQRRIQESRIEGFIPWGIEDREELVHLYKNDKPKLVTAKDQKKLSLILSKQHPEVSEILHKQAENNLNIHKDSHQKYVNLMGKNLWPYQVHNRYHTKELQAREDQHSNQERSIQNWEDEKREKLSNSVKRIEMENVDYFQRKKAHEGKQKIGNDVNGPLKRRDIKIWLHSGTQRIRKILGGTFSKSKNKINH